MSRQGHGWGLVERLIAKVMKNISKQAFIFFLICCLFLKAVSLSCLSYKINVL